MASDQKVLLTVILHHDQAKNLDQILAHTKETGIQLRVEPDAIRNVNIFFEKKAWGAFRYEVYPSYDFVAVAEKFKKEHA
jgi:hypothetical protein